MNKLNKLIINKKDFIFFLIVYLYSRFIIISGFIFAEKYLKKSIILGSRYVVKGYPFARFDSIFYHSIAKNGYGITYDGNIPVHTIVFFPLYPLLTRLFSIIFFTNIYLSMTIISNISGFLAALFFYKYVRCLTKNMEESAEIANFALILFLMVPISIYLNAAYARPILILFGIISFYMLTKEKVYIAGLFSGLASALNPIGISVVIGFTAFVLMKFFKKRGSTSIFDVVRLLLLILLSISGLLIFILYQWIFFKNPFEFIIFQNSANMLGNSSFISAIINGLTLKPIFMPNRTIFHFRLNEVFFGLFLFILIAAFYKKLLSTHILYFLSSLILIDYFFHIAKINYYSASDRILYLGFPIFFAVSLLIQKSRHKDVYLIFSVILFSIMLFYFAAWFYKGYWID